ncbi:MAG TPA: FAD-dependent oxidoreductase [Kofleriaceae bacterium]|nr:FAD-dependent oxidoreductase [Kofleriaceae bacterium]
MRDVIVVGAGGGGPVVAKELAQRGLDVLLLEAGPRHAHPRAVTQAVLARGPAPDRERALASVLGAHGPPSPREK